MTFDDPRYFSSEVGFVIGKPVGHPFYTRVSRKLGIAEGSWGFPRRWTERQILSLLIYEHTERKAGAAIGVNAARAYWEKPQPFIIATAQGAETALSAAVALGIGKRFPAWTMVCAHQLSLHPIVQEALSHAADLTGTPHAHHLLPGPGPLSAPRGAVGEVFG